jgi:nitrogen fixation protein FixH
MIQEVKGWHVLMVLMGFFGVTIGVNAYFVTVALQSAPGEYQKKSYLQGLRYNEVIAARAAQAELGWTAALETRTRPDGVFEIAVAIKDRAGQPLNALTLGGMLRRPAKSDEDRDLAFVNAGDGVYVARIDGVAKGQWRLDFDASGGPTPFHAEKTLWVR